MFFVLSQAWDKEKILSPREELSLRLSDSTLRLIYFLWCLTLVRVSGHGNKAIQFGRGNQVFVVQFQVKKKEINVYVAARVCSDYRGLNNMFQAFS